MSRRAVPALGGAVAALVLLATILWGHGGDDSTGQRAAEPTPSARASTSIIVSGADRDPGSGLAWVAVADLPPEAAETLELVDAGGPFRYPGKDGSAFGNFERLLPTEPGGYYAEYTVPTPGSRDRGARRIITGDGGELYWTADHYQHFGRIRR
jgi:ribonuclease T1